MTTTRPATDAVRIDELMAGPIKQRPAVTLFGDETVTGFTPAPLPNREVQA